MSNVAIRNEAMLTKRIRLEREHSPKPPIIRALEPLALRKSRHDGAQAAIDGEECTTGTSHVQPERQAGATNARRCAGRIGRREVRDRAGEKCATLPDVSGRKILGVRIYVTKTITNMPTTGFEHETHGLRA